MCSVIPMASASKSSNFTSMRLPAGMQDLSASYLWYNFAQDVLLQFLGRDVLQLQGLDGVGEEAARALEDGVRIAHQVDELGIGEHLHQLLDAPRVRRVLAEELGAVRVPQGNLDELDKRVLEQLQLFGRDVVEEEVLLRILLLVLGEEPEIIIGVRHHVGQGELLFLGQVHGQLHVVRGALVGHQPAHVLLEEGLPPHHQVREDGLIGGVVAEMLVARKDVVHEGRAAAPMAEDEHGVVLQRFVCQQFVITLVLQGGQRGEEAADSLGQPILVAVSGVYLSPGGHRLEGFPVGSHQGVDGEFIKFE